MTNFQENSLNFYIDGRWVEPANGIDDKNQLSVINPANEQIICHISTVSITDVDQAVKAAKIAFEFYQFSSVQERVDLLESILSKMQERFEDLAKSITLEIGVPYRFARDEQVTSGIFHLEIMIRHLQQFPFIERVNI